MKFIIIALVAVVLVLLAFAVFRRTSRRGGSQVRLAIGAEPDQVWRVINDVEREPEWLPDVEETSPDAEGGPDGFVRRFRSGAVERVAIRRSRPPAALLRHVQMFEPDGSPAYTATRLLVLKREPGGTRVSLIVRRDRSAPEAQAFATLVHGERDRARLYLECLKSRCERD